MEPLTVITNFKQERQST